MTTIRKAEDADESAVFALAQEFPATMSIDRTAFHDTWRHKLNDANSYIAVAEVGGTVVGYVSGYAHTTFYANGLTAWIDEILVREDMRRKGIGRKLMDELARWSKERGCKLAALATRRASEFYRALGYEDSARYYKKFL